MELIWIKLQQIISVASHGYASNITHLKYIPLILLSMFLFIFH